MYMCVKHTDSEVLYKRLAYLWPVQLLENITALRVTTRQMYSRIMQAVHVHHRVQVIPTQPHFETGLSNPIINSRQYGDFLLCEKDEILNLPTQFTAETLSLLYKLKLSKCLELKKLHSKSNVYFFQDFYFFLSLIFQCFLSNQTIWHQIFTFHAIKHIHHHLSFFVSKHMSTRMLYETSSTSHLWQYTLCITTMKHQN